jgi:serine/threonine protein kinase
MEKKKKTDKNDKPSVPKTFLLKNLIALDKLGKGTYGSVYKAQRGSEYVAIKKIKLDVDTEGLPSTALREIAILKKMKHPNIVR